MSVHLSSAKETKDIIFRKILPHPTYFLELAPPDYHLFRSIQSYLADLIKSEDERDWVDANGQVSKVISYPVIVVYFI